MGYGPGSTAPGRAVWPLPPSAKQTNTFVVDAEVTLGEADVVVLVLGAPGARQRRLVLVDRGVQALQAPAQLLLPWGRQPAPSAPAGGVSSLRAPSSPVRRRSRHLGGSCYCVTGGGEERDQIRTAQPMTRKSTGAAGKPSPSPALLFQHGHASPHFELYIPQCSALQRQTNSGWQGTLGNVVHTCSAISLFGRNFGTPKTTTPACNAAPASQFRSLLQGLMFIPDARVW